MSNHPAPVLLWLSAHDTLRYEEVPLLIEAGAQVIPAMGDDNILPFDTHYDDESRPNYPLWRKHCVLPTNIVERIRRIRFWDNRCALEKEDADFINEHVDAIMVASFPDMLTNLLPWFKGLIIYRAFGLGAGGSYSAWMEKCGVSTSVLARADNVIWAPALTSLTEIEDADLVKNTVVFPCSVSSERMGAQWNPSEADSFCTTVFSYADSNPVYRLRSEKFIKAFSAINVRILGKNKFSDKDEFSKKFTGFLSDQEFFSTISRSRLFIYAGGGERHHLHYTPVEAIAMGVPLLFDASSGLQAEASLNGITDDDLRACGMCDGIDELAMQAQELLENLEAAQALSRRQREKLLPLFSKERALASVQKLVALANGQRGRFETRMIGGYPVQHRFGPRALTSGLPTAVNETRSFPPEVLRGSTGAYGYENGTCAYRCAERLTHPAGILVGALLKNMTGSSYTVRVIFDADRFENDLGHFWIGAWMPGGLKEIASQPLTQQGAVEREGTIREFSDFSFHIPKEAALAMKEFRVEWAGADTVRIRAIEVTLDSLDDFAGTFRNDPDFVTAIKSPAGVHAAHAIDVPGPARLIGRHTQRPIVRLAQSKEYVQVRLGGTDRLTVTAPRLSLEFEVSAPEHAKLELVFESWVDNAVTAVHQAVLTVDPSVRRHTVSFPLPPGQPVFPILYMRASEGMAELGRVRLLTPGG